MQLLYLGFTQHDNIRKYLFHGLTQQSPGTRPALRTPLNLTADLSSLAKHQIPFQDGPELCLKILTAAVGAAEDMAGRFTSYAVTDTELSAFAAAKAAAKAAKSHRRKSARRVRPAAASQLKWPRTP